MKINKYPLIILVVTTAVCFSLWVASKFFVINISRSMPLGLYRIDPQHNSSHTAHVFEHDDIVAVCLDESNRDLGLKRAYILAGNKCHNSEPLIKTIFATPGDTIILNTKNIVRNGKIYPYPTVLVDSQGRALPIFPRGQYSKTSGYWLIGTNDKKSWDSRYWGPVTLSQILFKLTPIIIFK